MPTARTAAPAEPWYSKVGDFAQAMFPTLNNARESINGAIQSNIAQGNYARAAGNAASELVRYPAAVVNDVVAPPARAVLGAVPSFLGGLLGGSGSTTDAIPVAPAAAANPVASALTQGRAAAVVPAAAAAPTPQEELGATLARVLGRNPSIADIQAVGNLVPVSAKPVQSAKDQIFGATAQLSGAMYQKELEDAAKVNAVGTPEYSKAFQKATDSYFQRNASLISNPARLAQAELLTPQQDQ